MKEKMEMKVDRFLKQKGFAFEAKKILSRSFWWG